MDKLIEKVIFSFYQKAIQDILIGYHFRSIKNFDEHIPHIARFWEYRLTDKPLPKGKYHFLQAHQKLKVKMGEVDRWLVLFKENLNEFPEVLPFKEKWLQEIENLAKALKKAI